MKTNLFKSGLLLFCILLSACKMPNHSETTKPSKTIPYEILVFHPSISTAESAEQTIFQSLEKSGYIIEYYLDIPSVICGGDLCEIITVRLFWNTLGHFQRYEFPTGGNLTKIGHKTFTKADHEKLQSILCDADSGLKQINPNHVVAPGKPPAEEIDCTSGATILSEETEIVSGAADTCYTLWHWVHSDIPNECRKISADTMSEEQLTLYLKNGTPAQKSFAKDVLKDHQRE